MANSSGINGQMVLDGRWTPSMIEKLNVVKSEWSNWYYYIILEDFVSEDQPLPFTANGNWRFDATLDKLNDWTLGTNRNEIMIAYTLLCNEMLSDVDEFNISNARMLLSFVEEEGGCMLLREATAEILCSASQGLYGIITSSVEFEYTKENLVKLGFCNSIDGIDWI